MWQGREIVACTLAFLAGNVLGDVLSFPPSVYLVLSVLFAAISLLRPSWAWLLACFVMLGAGSVQLGRMPPAAADTALAEWAARCKSAFSNWLGGMLPAGDELSVLQALSIGEKGSLSRDLKAAYRGSGAMHLLALSGLHVGLIYALLVQLFRPLGGFRPARLFRSVCILGALWAYAVITGLSASISRAVLMITVYESSMFLSGDRDGLAALSGSALLLMILRPEIPRDLGFQLSYTAVLSILLFHPWMKNRLQTRSRLLSRIWELLSVSLCCQATCGVLAWWYFGSFPSYFLLTAILAIPLATLALYAIVAAVAFAGLARLAPFLLPFSETLFRLLGRLLHILNTVVRLIAGL